MHSALFSLAILACLLAAVYVGRFVGCRLPPHHLSTDSKDSIRLAMGLVATMAALLLGLLVSSAKGGYDTQRNEVIEIAAKIILLDRMLALYGPDAAEVRTRLHTSTEEAVRRLWPRTADAQRGLEPQAESWGHGMYPALLRLSPRDPVQRGLRKHALALSVDLGRLRSLLASQSVPNVSTPLVLTVVGWLVVIFLGFSVIAPRNWTSTLALALSSVSVATAIFLILELDRPFGGWIEIPSEPFELALKQMAP